MVGLTDETLFPLTDSLKTAVFEVPSRTVAWVTTGPKFVPML